MTFVLDSIGHDSVQEAVPVIISWTLGDGLLFYSAPSWFKDVMIIIKSRDAANQPIEIRLIFAKDKSKIHRLVHLTSRSKHQALVLKHEISFGRERLGSAYPVTYEILSRATDTTISYFRIRKYKNIKTLKER